MEAEKMIAMPEDDFRLHVVRRLNAQDEAIAENTALTRKTDETVTQVAEDTRFIRETWKDGVAAVRFFCRLAEAWRFVIRFVMFPIGVVMLVAYVANHDIPSWVSGIAKLFKLFF